MNPRERFDPQQGWRRHAAELVAGRSRLHGARLDGWRRQGLVPDQTLWEMVETGAARFGDTRFSFIGPDGDAEYDLAAMVERARRVANGLAALGLGKGDVVVVQSASWEVATLAFWAALHLGAVTVPIVPIYGPAEVGDIARRSGAKILIVPDRWRELPLPQRIAAMGAMPSVEHVVAIGGNGGGAAVDWSELLDPSHPATAPAWSEPDEVCALLFTSGTTAAPKGVLHSHRSIGAEILSMPRIFPTDARPVFLNVLPAGHVAGFSAMLRPAHFGVHTVFLEKWDARAAADLVRGRGVGVSTGTPFHLAALLDQGVTADNSGLSSYLVGAASVAPSLVEHAWAVGIRAFRLYGSTELPTITAGTPDDAMERCALTDGRPMPGVEVRIVDDAGVDLGAGVAGEVLAVGPELCLGYTDPDHNRQAFTQDGWYRTGDIAVLDEHGYLTIVDRKKDIIIRGGENISSREVEDVLSRHPAVADCAAVGAPDERYGERIAVFVRLRPGAKLDLEEVAAHFAAAGVARQKTPERIVVVAGDFERNGAGKILKAPLRDRLRQAV